MGSLGPVTLEGSHVRLEPLRPAHREGLLEAAQTAEIWKWMPVDLRSGPSMDRWIQEALAEENRGTAYAFAVRERSGERIVGSTRYAEIRPEHRGAEIGWSWYAPDTWGTAVNPECKLLLLRHAFDGWGALRMQLKTDHMNLHSRRAIEKLGARFEGTLRNHRIRPDGTIRHTVMYSITAEEWPAVRTALEARLAPAMPPGLRRAVAGDAAAVRSLVTAAYAPYTGRMGREPAPMGADHGNLIAKGEVWVLDRSGVVGVLVMRPEGSTLLVENIAVHPAHQRQGLGGTLLDFAESTGRGLGLRSVRLYTNEAMLENLSFYAHRGYQEEARVIEEGYRRVYLTKPFA